MSAQELVPAIMDELASRLDGEIVRPADAAYEDARRVWNGMIDRRPEMIVRCASKADAWWR